MRSLIVILFALTLICPVVLADEASQQIATVADKLSSGGDVPAGITPDSMFYGIDQWWDEMRINMASKVSEKALIRLEIADERLSEIKVMAQKNKTKEVEIAEAGHNQEIQATDTLTDNLDDSIRLQLQERFQRHIMNLERVQAQVPAQAKEGLQHALDNANRMFDRQQAKISVSKRLTKEVLREHAQNIKVNKAIGYVEIPVFKQKNNQGNATEKSQTINQTRLVGHSLRE